MTRLRLVTAMPFSGGIPPEGGEPPFEGEDEKGDPPRKEVPELGLIKNFKEKDNGDQGFILGRCLLAEDIDETERDP